MEEIQFHGVTLLASYVGYRPGGAKVFLYQQLLIITNMDNQTVVSYPVKEFILKNLDSITFGEL